MMFKNGMIGNCQKINLNFGATSLGIKGINNVSVPGANYWLDNHLTYGGSGGPIVNMNGELLGIVCEKAFTESKIGGIKKFAIRDGYGIIAPFNKLGITILKQIRI